MYFALVSGLPLYIGIEIILASFDAISEVNMVSRIVFNMFLKGFPLEAKTAPKNRN